MNQHTQLIWKKLENLRRLRGYLAFSLTQTLPLMPIRDWKSLTPHEHETLAAFRLRFSEFQEHLGKAMRAIAIEEEQRTEPFTAVLLYMEKLDIIDTSERWKSIRELRNAVNHEYEENTERLSEFFVELTKSAPELFRYQDRLADFCESNYRGKAE